MKYKKKGPKYFRLSSFNHSLNFKNEKNFFLMKKGKRGLILVAGPALRFIEKNFNQFDANIIYFNQLKPLNKNFLNKYFNEKIILIQDFYKGSITADIISIFENKNFIFH